MSIEKFISPFIQSQFPDFYKSDGPNFVAFVKAYYEWLETSPNPLYKARELYDMMDVDRTAEDFVKYFKNKYMFSIPQSAVADKRLLSKHILDLYRSKGSLRSYELLFRLLFNEDVSVYIPKNDIFKLSDNEWIRPKYIEVTGHQYLHELIGKRIYSSSKQSDAVVENYFVKKVNNKTINVLSISAVNGIFNYGDTIFCDDLYVNSRQNLISEFEYNNLTAAEQEDYSLAITEATSPIIIGSLSSVGIINGGANFKPGELLSVANNGVGGVVRVVAVRSENGKVTFELLDGGSGFSMSPSITVLPTKVLTIENFNGSFSANDSLLKEHQDTNVDPELIVYQTNGSVNTAMGGLYSGNTTYLRLVNSNGTFDVLKPVYILDRRTYLTISSPTDTLYLGEEATQGSANGVVTFANDTHVVIGNTNGTFAANATKIVMASNSSINATVVTVSNSIVSNSTLTSWVGGGAGATFTIGDLIDKEIFRINSDLISSYYNADMDDIAEGVSITITGTVGTFSAGETVTSASLVVQPLDVTNIVGSFVNNQILANTTLGINTLNLLQTDGSYIEVYGADIGNANLVPGIVVKSTTTTSTAEINTLLPQQTISGTGIILNVNSTVIEVTQQTGRFLSNTVITSSNSGATATITSTDYMTDWSFPGVTGGLDKDNLNDVIDQVLTIYDLEVGTITYLDNINPGQGYSTDPVVSIIQEDVYNLKIPDRSGYKGYNAIINATAGTADGIVTAAAVYDSGFGYDTNERVLLTSSNALNQTVVTATSVVDQHGVAAGYFKNQSGFLSDSQKIIDSEYYQEYSYDIQATRMMETYEKFVRDLIHPSGIALFGSYKLNKEVDTGDNTVVESSITSS